MQMICLDLEGVLVPEIWIAFSQRTGITELSRTTRDEPDYDKLMRYRIDLLTKHGLKLADIQAVIAGMGPMEGAREFLDDLRSRFQVLILSDTFYEFAQPLMRQLGWPTLLCHRLEIDRGCFAFFPMELTRDLRERHDPLVWGRLIADDQITSLYQRIIAL